jgi:hypothetical protein
MPYTKRHVAAYVGQAHHGAFADRVAPGGAHWFVLSKEWVAWVGFTVVYDH